VVEKKLLTLEQAAELLGVDYKTVYRLVRSGQIPAGKVGRVYRIAPDDLKAYFEGQKRRQRDEARSGAVAAGAFNCAGCGRSYLSRLSVGGECEVCGEPLCTDCWSALGRRRCRAHETAAGDPSNRTGGTRSACGRCGRPFSRDWQAAGGCQEPGCGAPLCDRCWADEDDRFCEQHSARGVGRDAVIRTLRDAGKPVVEASQARAAEVGFIKRFEEGTLGLSEFVDPTTGRTAAAAECEREHSTADQAERVRGLLKDGLGLDEIRSRFPTRAVSRYEVRTRARRGPALNVTLEARCRARLEQFAKSGFDHEPMTLTDLNAVLESAIAEAEQAGRALILVVGSPTGWAKDAVRHIAGGRRAFRHRLVAVALWDLREDVVHVQADDGKLDGYLDLVAPAAAADAFERVAEYVKKRLVRREAVAVAEVMERLELGRRTVTTAFNRLGAEREYVVVSADDIGTVISRR